MTHSGSNRSATSGMERRTTFGQDTPARVSRVKATVERRLAIQPRIIATSETKRGRIVHGSWLAVATAAGGFSDAVELI